MSPSTLLVAAAAALSIVISSAAAIAAAARAAPGAVLLVGNKGENTLSFVDLATGEELTRLPTGNMPHEIAISPDDAKAAVVAYGGTTIDVFDIATRAKLNTINLAPNDFGPEGKLYAAETGRNQVAEIDLATGEVLRRLPAGAQGDGLAIVGASIR